MEQGTGVNYSDAMTTNERTRTQETMKNKKQNNIIKLKRTRHERDNCVTVI